MSETAAPEVDVKKLLSIVGPVIASTATGLIVNAALSAVKRASVTNSNKSTVAGDDEMHPTKKETSLVENDAAGTKTDSNMASDDVNIQSGAVEASETEAKASTAETTASEAGATASRVKAGASDVETKAMKIM